MESIRNFQQRVREKVGNDLYRHRGRWDKSLRETWISTLCRILIGIHKYKHGGAVLISDNDQDFPSFEVTRREVPDQRAVSNLSQDTDVLDKHLRTGAVPGKRYVQIFSIGHR